MFIKLIIDRFEEEWVILETQDNNPITFNFPRHLLPKEVEEGTILIIDINIDQEETKKRRKKVKRLLEKMKKQDKGGDIQL